MEKDVDIAQILDNALYKAIINQDYQQVQNFVHRGADVSGIYTGTDLNSPNYGCSMLRASVLTKIIPNNDARYSVIRFLLQNNALLESDQELKHLEDTNHSCCIQMIKAAELVRDIFRGSIDLTKHAEIPEYLHDFFLALIDTELENNLKEKGLEYCIKLIDKLEESHALLDETLSKRLTVLMDSLDLNALYVQTIVNADPLIVDIPLTLSGYIEEKYS